WDEPERRHGPLPAAAAMRVRRPVIEQTHDRVGKTGDGDDVIMDKLATSFCQAFVCAERFDTPLQRRGYVDIQDTSPLESSVGAAALCLSSGSTYRSRTAENVYCAAMPSSFSRASASTLRCRANMRSRSASEPASANNG